MINLRRRLTRGRARSLDMTTLDKPFNTCGAIGMATARFTVSYVTGNERNGDTTSKPCVALSTKSVFQKFSLVILNVSCLRLCSCVSYR